MRTNTSGASGAFTIPPLPAPAPEPERKSDDVFSMTPEERRAFEFRVETLTEVVGFTRPQALWLLRNVKGEA